MALLVGMSVLVTSVRRRAGREGDDAFSTNECKSLISEKYGEMYCHVAETGYRYFETEGSLTITGAASYPEPSDMLSFIGIDRVLDTAGHRVALVEIMAQERHEWMGSTGDAATFQVVDDQIFLHPKPSSGTYKVLYIPQPPDLSIYADSDQVDLVNPFGRTYLVNAAAVAMCGPKTEIDPRLLISERDLALQNMIEWATLRMLQQPRRRVVVGAPSDLSDPDMLIRKWPT